VTARFRLLVAAVVASAGVLLASAPAQAVQTSTWGITAAPSGQHQRTSLSHPADGSTVHDAVIVYNRTARPITVHLYVLGTNLANGVYQFSRPDAGLAADTGIGTHTVNLGPYQRVRVPVTIHMPRGVKSTALAGIGAEASPVNDGDLSIVQQLVVLVKATPSGHVVPIVVKDIGIWGSAALIVLLLIGAFAERERRRSKRSSGGVPVPVAA
jgi:hypothetical protein